MAERSGADLEFALRQVLDIMCMARVTEEPEHIATAGWLAMRVEFRGASHGEMRLRMPEETACHLAATFLGRRSSGEVTATEAVQVAGELTNMICGCFLSRLESAQIFELSAPRPYPPDTPQPQPSLARHYRLDKGSLYVALALTPWR